MSEPRSSWTRRDPQCVTAMRVCVSACVCVSIRPFAANWNKFIMAWWETTQNCHRVCNIFPTCLQKLARVRSLMELIIFTVTLVIQRASALSFGGILHVSLDVRHTVVYYGVVGTWCLHWHASQLQWAAYTGLLQKLVLYSRNKASRRQMSSTLPSLPPGQMAKLDNMLSKITLKSHGGVSVCLPACLSILPPMRPGHLCWGVAPGQGQRGVVWDDEEASASLIAVDWYQSAAMGCRASRSISGDGEETGGYMSRGIWGGGGCLCVVGASEWACSMTMRDEQPATWSASAGASL